MTALDSCEPQVIRAFQKEGWEIFQKPHLIPYERSNLWADASFQRIIGDRLETVIIVEIKCFTNQENDLQEFYTAQGQYNLYRSALKVNRIDLPLYLALPETAYRRLTAKAAVVDALQTLEIKLVVVDLVMEEIVAWKT